MVTWHGLLPLYAAQHLETGDLWCDPEGQWFKRTENLSWEEVTNDKV